MKNNNSQIAQWQSGSVKGDAVAGSIPALATNNGKERMVSQVTVFRRATQSGLREAKRQASSTASGAGSIPAFATKVN
jgi:hypothetical protein